MKKIGKIAPNILLIIYNYFEAAEISQVLKKSKVHSETQETTTTPVLTLYRLICLLNGSCKVFEGVAKAEIEGRKR